MTIVEMRDKRAKLWATPIIIYTIFYSTCVFFYIVKMIFNIVFTHHKTIKFDIIKILLCKILFPIERNIPTFNNKILLVFYGCFYHFTNNRPHICFKFGIIFRCEFRVTTTN